MTHLALLLLASALVLTVAAAAVVRYRRKSALSVEEPAPRSMVRVLRSDEELREAVDRAVRFERVLADSLQTRTRRYEAMVRPAPITRIETALTARSEAADDPAPRSA